jgi:mRNA-degrading endonuclease RelE of RelBE toxin-antitoxin system
MSDFWVIKRTEVFLRCLKKHKSNHQLFIEIDSKLQRLKADPFSVGGELHGSLHGLRSTRLCGKFRMIFEISTDKKEVYLISLDHRQEVYG